MTDPQKPYTSATSTLPDVKKPRIDVDVVLADERKIKAYKFHQAIMANLVSSESNEIVGVMNAVPDPYTASAQNVVIRQEDYTFWHTTLQELAVDNTNVPPKRIRMTVVGTPGIGKSTTVSLAIRIVLSQRKTVVYLHRTLDREAYYIEFIPLENQNDEHEVQIELHSEKLSPTQIPSLSQTETYYFVDPGETKTSCNPSKMVAARLIIVASPDERHWGGSSFGKDDQQGLGGFIRYFPPWSLAQLTAASTALLNVQFQENQVAELYSLFGGIPRVVFSPTRKQENEKELKRKVEALTDVNLRNLVTGQLNRHSGFGAGQPGGGIVAFVPSDNYKDAELKLASSSILKWVRIRSMNSIWTELATYPSPISWQLLEDYMLHALQTTIQYTVRVGVGKTDIAYTQLQSHILGSCTDKTLAADCTASVLNGPDWTVFYSSDRLHPLYDMIYRVGSIYYAFQITIGKSHDAKQQQISTLVQRLQIGTGGRELKLYYAVHEGVFDNFVTKPVEANAVPGVSIFHLKLEKGLVA
jgi:hypothetical protein